MTDTAVEVSDRDLAVSEVFGPTFQGEGPSCGQRAAFVRLARCNLACRWCDTPYTWDWKGVTPTGPYDPAEQVHGRSIAELVDTVVAMGTELVVITGGEPLLQQRALAPLVSMLVTEGRRIEVETNGTIAPTSRLRGLVARFNVSPKLHHSQAAPIERRIVTDVLDGFAALPTTAFKFVVSHPDQLTEVDAIVDQASILPRQVWVMPEGTSGPVVTARAAALAEPVLARGYNLSTRLHVLLWGDERGR